jgi:chemotaxis protein methyltransferase CheR
LISVGADPSYLRLKNQLIASTGLAFYADRDNELTELIGQRLSDLRLCDCSSYSQFLADSAGGAAEMDVLIARLTIGETSFFRDPEQFAAIRDIILPDIFERKQSSKQLRIWSAGCSTGAEPYSLAILMARELAERIAGWDIGIHATDLNRDFLARAAEGKFRAWTLRSAADEVKRECFSHEGHTWTIHPRYKQWISFRQMNLAAREFSNPLGEDARFDLILCRNVMIYFSPEINRRLIGQFHQSLEDYGWLVVGSSEHNPENYKNFSSVDASGARIYQKRPAKLAALEMATEPQVQPRPAPEPKPREKPRIEAPRERDRTDLEELRQLADRGDWQSASEYGQRLLAGDRLNPEIHFFLALVFENLGMVDEPERSLRQALYLDRNFALAHYHLGLALKRDGQMAGAARSFGNVLKVLNGIPDETAVMAGRGITAISLKELSKMHQEQSAGS